MKQCMGHGKKCKIKQVKRLKILEQNPGHHTLILNDSSSSSENSSRLALKLDHSPLNTLSKPDTTFQNTGRCICVPQKKDQRQHQTSSYLSNRAELSSPRQNFRTITLEKDI